MGGISLKPRGSGGGSGFALGPAQNTFGTTSTANKAAAIALLTTYATANTAWLAKYTADRSFFIQLVWTGNASAFQRRNAAGSAWEDVTGIVRGQKGNPGPVTDLTSKITAEETARVAADTTEATTRANADTALGKRIDGLPATPTLADLGGLTQAQVDARAVVRYTADEKTKLAGIAAGATTTLAEGGVINLGVVTPTSDRLTAVAPSGYSRYPNGTLLLFKAAYGQLDSSWTDSLNFYIGTDRYDLVGDGTSDIRYSNLIADTYYLAVVDGAVQILGPVKRSGDPTDVQIGDKAFSNPPSDLTDAEKTAALAAVGAAALAGAIFTGETGGIAPTADNHFVTLAYFNTNKGSIMPIVIDDMYFGVSVDNVPQGDELNIPAVQGVGVIPAYAGNRYLLIARLATEGDISSVRFSGDGAHLNQFGAFSKYTVGTVMPTGEVQPFNVWVTNQNVTLDDDATVTVI